MSVEWKQRPIDEWPGELTKHRRSADFSAAWGKTLALLDRELHQLGARNVVCQVALRERDFRVTDGQPKSRAVAEQPGVILAFDSKYGPLRYACDTFYDFSDNVRAIALGLEALRKVDRYGISKDGQQYKGYNALGSGVTTGEPMSLEEAARVLADLADSSGVLDGADILAGRVPVDEAYRLAARETHPDHGGNPAAFRAATEARDVLVSS